MLSFTDSFIKVILTYGFVSLIRQGQCHAAVVAAVRKGLPDASLSNAFPRVTHNFAKHKLIEMPFSPARWLPGADFSLLIWTKWSGCFWQLSWKKRLASATVKFLVESYWSVSVSVGCQTVGLGLLGFCLEREEGMSIQETYVKRTLFVLRNQILEIWKIRFACTCLTWLLHANAFFNYKIM